MSKANTTAPARIALPLGAQSGYIALHVGSIEIDTPADGGERSLPDRLHAMPWGVTDTNKGRLIVNETTVGVLAHNQAKAKFDRVAFDFQHNTVHGTPKDEPLKVAGWGTPEVVPGEGIYLSSIEYTADGRESLLGGHYPDLSPTLRVNDSGEVIFMHSLAAVRQGEVDGLTLFTPPAGTKSARALAALNAEGLTALAADDDDADGKFAKDGQPNWRAITIAALNAAGASLDDDAEADDILSAVAALRQPAAPSPKPTPDPDPVKTMSAEVPSAKPAPVADANAAIETRLVALEAETAGNKRQAITAAAAQAGKVIPLSAESIEKLEPAVLQEMVDALPAGQVPLSSETDGAEDVTLSAGATAADLAVAQQLGLSADDLKQYA